jgi:hypothetical protein
MRGIVRLWNALSARRVVATVQIGPWNNLSVPEVILPEDERAKFTLAAVGPDMKRRL